MDFSKVDTIIVHNGPFHADDVFCVALMDYIFDKCFYIQRVDMVPKAARNDHTLICDIGSGKFDHHQVDAKIDEWGHKYCSVELLLHALKADNILSEESFGAFSPIFKNIGRGDNGEYSSIMCNIIDKFNPSWKEATAENYDLQFEIACRYALDFLKSVTSRYGLVCAAIIAENEKYEAALEAEILLKQKLKDMEDGIIILDQSMPWEKVVCADIDAKFVIYPSIRGGWNLQCVPPTLGSFEQRLPLKEATEMLKEKGCIFAHPAKFLAAFKTKENAFTCATNLIKEYEYGKYNTTN